MGYHAIAVSLACRNSDPAAHYSTAAAVVMAFLDWFKENQIPNGVLYNINVPNVPIRGLKGILPTRKGTRLYRDKVTKFKDPHGRDCYWMGGVPEDHMEEGTDVWAVANGYASITPVHMDMTHYDTLEAMRSKGVDALLKRA